MWEGEAAYYRGAEKINIIRITGAGSLTVAEDGTNIERR